MRGLILALGLTASACAPAPVAMDATEASELLARFADGAAPADVCTTQGRALLRGAVRAYGAEMQQAGVAWPSVPGFGADADDLTSLDTSVLVAFAAGFVEASDFQGSARSVVGQLPFAQWPAISSMREAAQVACADVVQLQRAASHFVLEAARYQALVERAAKAGAGLAERMRRQSQRMERAQSQMDMLAAVVTTRLEHAGRS
jgi:hypothetical protein